MKTIKTLDDILNLKSQYELKNITLFKDVDGITVHQQDLFSRYRNLIYGFVQEFTINENIRRKYHMKPEKLSIDLYGTPHLDWMLLQMNGFESQSKFILGNRLRIIPKDKIETVFDVVLSKNVEDISENHAEFDID